MIVATARPCILAPPSDSKRPTELGSSEIKTDRGQLGRGGAQLSLPVILTKVRIQCHEMRRSVTLDPDFRQDDGVL